MRNKICFLLALLVIINLISLVFKSSQDQISNVVPAALTQFINLNSSDDGLTGANPDGTMGPVSFRENYSSSLPDSVKGSLSFYVTDPPGSPPGLNKKNPPTNTPKPSVEITKEVIKTPALPEKDAKLTELILTINKVEVHRIASGSSAVRWETLDIGTTPKIIDFIDLADKKLDLILGETKLEAGRYTEIRLYITSALAKYDDGGQADLKIPGKKNIVRVVREFTIEAGQTTKIIIDINSQRSVVRTENNFLLKPVVARMIVE